MAHLQVLCTLLGCVTFFACSCDGMVTVVCRECKGSECDVDPSECLYGTATDTCTNRLVCRKGPGERCGGIIEIDGKCGAGMKCTCNRCTGCSQDYPMSCFELDYFCPTKHHSTTSNLRKQIG